MLPPQVNDLLAYAYGDKAGQPVSASDLEPASKQVFAFALDPATGMMRNGTRMNQVLLVRLDPATLAPETAARSVNGLVAYSGVCSHTGCDVTDWNGEFKRFQCPCHESQFDPSNGAKVVGGPAPLAEVRARWASRSAMKRVVSMACAPSPGSRAMAR